MLNPVWEGKSLGTMAEDRHTLRAELVQSGRGNLLSAVDDSFMELSVPQFVEQYGGAELKIGIRGSLQVPARIAAVRGVRGLHEPRQGAGQETGPRWRRITRSCGVDATILHYPARIWRRLPLLTSCLTFR